jgi:uncharacterized protein YjbJ (UPF0337 family)
VAGREDQIVGKTKEFKGKVTGDKTKESQGKAQNAKGRVEKGAQDTVDRAKGAAGAAGDKLRGR